MQMKNNGLDEEFEGLDAVMEDDLYTELDDDARAELDDMIGLKVLGLELWEESLGDDEEEGPVSPEERVFFDCDLYLEDDLALELYATAAYPDPEGDPAQGMDAIFAVVGKLADDDLELVDYDQADEEGGLALAFGRSDKVELVLVASAWTVSEWEAEEEDSEEDEEA
jgi:hypothetical protein